MNCKVQPQSQFRVFYNIGHSPSLERHHSGCNLSAASPPTCTRRCRWINIRDSAFFQSPRGSRKKSIELQKFNKKIFFAYLTTISRPWRTLSATNERQASTHRLARSTELPQHHKLDQHKGQQLFPCDCRKFFAIQCTASTSCYLQSPML